MPETPFALPAYLPQTAASVRHELAAQQQKLGSLGLSQIYERICNLGTSGAGYSIHEGTVICPQLHSGAEEIARDLVPWRKGPFALGDLLIDAEWRSDIKWNRLKSQLPDMTGKTVADVGCNNGYYLYRIAEAGAKNILGLDPTLKYWLQYQLIAAHTGSIADYLPLGWQALWQMQATFDTIFLMGVNYHDRDPLEMFHACHRALRPGGTLLCESVVADTDADLEIFPEGRYAGIGGVYAIPSPRALKRQLDFVGFQEVTLLHSDPLLPAEQRSSEYSPQASLADHLRAEDAWSKEGYPPPYRAALLCRV
ncbi:MAG: tRNA 5-methoxyuridine(34)/uridine 5-oxyacetic acid(34) synthase CmoB [Spirochaetota bacterium]